MDAEECKSKTEKNAGIWEMEQVTAQAQAIFPTIGIIPFMEEQRQMDRQTVGGQKRQKTTEMIGNKA